MSCLVSPTRKLRSCAMQFLRNFDQFANLRNFCHNAQFSRDFVAPERHCSSAPVGDRAAGDRDRGGRRRRARSGEWQRGIGGRSVHMHVRQSDGAESHSRPHCSDVAAAVDICCRNSALSDITAGTKVDCPTQCRPPHYTAGRERLGND